MNVFSRGSGTLIARQGVQITMQFTPPSVLAKTLQRQRSAGFTLLEILLTLIIIGTMWAIAAPSWASFSTARQLTMARDELHQGIRQAQAAAMAQQSAWRFSLRQHADHWEWAIHPDTQDASDVKAWQSLNPNIQIDPADTTLAKKQGVYYVRFGYRGEVQYRLGTITVTSGNGLAQNRCVVISTLLGATRKGQENLYPNGNGRYCY